MSNSIVLYSRDLLDGGKEFILHISEKVLVDVELTGADQKLVAECESAGASIGDRLLALQLIVWRYEQQHEIKSKASPVSKDEEGLVSPPVELTDLTLREVSIDPSQCTVISEDG